MYAIPLGKKMKR